MKTFLLKYKKIILVALVVFAVVAGLRFLSQNKPAGKTSTTPGISTEKSTTEKPEDKYVPPQYAQIPPLEELDPQKVKDSVAGKKKLADKLPIYITDYRISNGMKTTLNVYSVEGDPDYIIHIEIYGVNYEEQNTDPLQNTNVTAFVESFQEIKKQLSTRGVDLTKMYFVFGSRQYIQKTAELWIKTFKLL